MIRDDVAASFSEAECCAEHDHLYPAGFGGPDVIEAIAPGGLGELAPRARISPHGKSNL